MTTKVWGSRVASIPSRVQMTKLPEVTEQISGINTDEPMKAEQVRKKREVFR